MPCQRVKPCKRLVMHLTKWSTRQRRLTVAQAGDGLAHSRSDTRDAQHTDTLFDSTDLVGNPSTAKEETLGAVFHGLFRVKGQRVDHERVTGLKVCHGQGGLIGPGKLSGKPQGSSHCRVALWRTHARRHDGKTLPEEAGLDKRRRPNPHDGPTHESPKHATTMASKP